MKIKRYNMSSEFLRTVLGPGLKHWEVEKNAIPPDAELVRISVDQMESSVGQVSLFFTCASFPDLPEGTLLDGEKIWIKAFFPVEDLEIYCEECRTTVRPDPYNPNYLKCDCPDRKQVDAGGPIPDMWKHVLVQKFMKEL